MTKPLLKAPKLAPGQRLPIPNAGPRDTALQHGHLRVLITDVEDHAEEGTWRHVSVSCAGRSPSHEELSLIRDEYFDPAATVLQVIPPRSAWVNQHEFCLHLWQRLDQPILPNGLDRTVGVMGGVPFDANERELMQRGHDLAAMLHNLLRARGTVTVDQATELLRRYFNSEGNFERSVQTALETLASTSPHIRRSTLHARAFRYTGPRP